MVYSMNVDSQSHTNCSCVIAEYLQANKKEVTFKNASPSKLLVEDADKLHAVFRINLTFE